MFTTLKIVSVAFLNRCAMKRSRLEICVEVLQIINRGVHKPTRIMYKSNLSWIPLCEVLNFLTNQGAIMVKTLGKKREYYITERGKEILGYYEHLRSMLMEKTGFPRG